MCNNRTQKKIWFRIKIRDVLAFGKTNQLYISAMFKGLARNRREKKVKEATTKNEKDSTNLVFNVFASALKTIREQIKSQKRREGKSKKRKWNAYALLQQDESTLSQNSNKNWVLFVVSLFSVFDLTWNHENWRRFQHVYGVFALFCFVLFVWLYYLRLFWWKCHSHTCSTEIKRIKSKF